MGAKLSGSGGGKFALGQNADINVTPFVDVMLVLLIIFMVAAPMATVAVKVDLPPPQAPVGPPPKPPVFVSVQPSGQIFVSGREVTLANLTAELGKAVGGANPQAERVMIRADKSVKYAQFMGVMNTLQGGGFIKVGIISEAL